MAEVEEVTELSDEDEDDVIEFEEDVDPSEMDHDPLDDPQECCGCKLGCTKRAVRKVLGLSLVAIAAFMFSLVTLGVKTSIHANMDFCGVLLFRGLVSWVINLCVMLGRKIPFNQMFGVKNKVPLLCLLGVFGAFAQMFGFYAVSILSMADANVYMMTSPVFVFLLARVWLGDPVDYVDVISAVVCIVGVMFVSKPSVIFGCSESDDCGLTEYCAVSGSCTDCGSPVEPTPTLMGANTTDGYTAFQICSGAESITTTMLDLMNNTGWYAYCDTSWNIDFTIVTVDDLANEDCHSACLAKADCGFFSSGYVLSDDSSGGSIEYDHKCVLYLGEECNATTINTGLDDGIDKLPVDGFTTSGGFEPELYRMLGEQREEDANAKGLAIVAAIASAAFAAVTYCAIRKIGHGIDGLVCVNYFSFLTFVIAGLGTIFQHLPLPNHDLAWGAVIGMGVAGFLGQYCLTVGFQLEKPGPASVIRYCDVIFVFIWDAAFFFVVPGWNNYVGAALVILAAVGIVMNKSRKQKLGVKQGKPLLNFGDCACCCRPQEGDDGGGEIAHDDTPHAKKKGGARAVAYTTDVELDTQQITSSKTRSPSDDQDDKEESPDDGLDEMERTI